MHFLFISSFIFIIFSSSMQSIFICIMAHFFFISSSVVSLQPSIFFFMASLFLFISSSFSCNILSHISWHFFSDSSSSSPSLSAIMHRINLSAITLLRCIFHFLALLRCHHDFFGHGHVVLLFHFHFLLGFVLHLHAFFGHFVAHLFILFHGFHAHLLDCHHLALLGFLSFLFAVFIHAFHLFLHFLHHFFVFLLVLVHHRLLATLILISVFTHEAYIWNRIILHCSDSESLSQPSCMPISLSPDIQRSILAFMLRHFCCSSSFMSSYSFMHLAFMAAIAHSFLHSPSEQDSHSFIFFMIIISIFFMFSPSFSSSISLLNISAHLRAYSSLDSSSISRHFILYITIAHFLPSSDSFSGSITAHFLAIIPISRL